MIRDSIKRKLLVQNTPGMGKGDARTITGIRRHSWWCSWIGPSIWKLERDVCWWRRLAPLLKTRGLKAEWGNSSTQALHKEQETEARWQCQDFPSLNSQRDWGRLGDPLPGHVMGQRPDFMGKSVQRERSYCIPNRAGWKLSAFLGSLEAWPQTLPTACG